MPIMWQCYLIVSSGHMTLFLPCPIGHESQDYNTNQKRSSTRGPSSDRELALLSLTGITYRLVGVVFLSWVGGWGLYEPEDGRRGRCEQVVVWQSEVVGVYSLMCPDTHVLLAKECLQWWHVLSVTPFWSGMHKMNEIVIKARLILRI